MSDFSFMKTGFNNVQENDEERKKDIGALVTTFAQNALQTSAIYVSHGGRKEVTPEDIKRAMMMEVFVFMKRPEIVEKVNQVKQEIYDNDESSDEENSMICEDTEEFAESECDCALCKCLNTIKQRWSEWNPENGFERIFKKNIDGTF